MASAKKFEHYLALANDADQQAAKCKDDSSREAWKAIAVGYRYLAGTEGRPKAQHTDKG